MPSLISSRFPQANDVQLQRIAGFVKHVLNPNLNLEDSIINDRWRLVFCSIGVCFVWRV